MTHDRSLIDAFFSPPPPKNQFSPADLQSQINHVDPSWRPLVNEWYHSGPGREMNHLLLGERHSNAIRKSGTSDEMKYIYPEWPLKALNMTSLTNAKVVIIGDEPCRVGNIADGLAFSSALPQRYSDTTRAIRDELARDLGVIDYGLSNLDHWANRGILLLNCTLTISSHAQKSHVGIGWEELTDKVLDTLVLDAKPRVFLLWGTVAQTKADRIKKLGKQHLVLTASSPNSNPRANTFIGCGHFRKAIEFLAKQGVSIDWIRPNPATTLLEAHHESLLDGGKHLKR
jgi:uracil-DNA glycosylase